jgi:hypothetical protein
LNNYFLDAIGSVSDITDLENRLAKIFSIRKQLFFGIRFSLIIHISLFSYDIVAGNAILLSSFGFGLIISNIILNILYGSSIYIIFEYSFLVIRLGQYRVKLYSADPRKSECIDRLADILNYGMIIVATFSAVLTFFFASYSELFPLPNLVLLVFLIWGPTIFLFLFNQYALSRLIINTKWRVLNDIQRQITELQTQEKIINEKTVDHINKLMDYHDRISATRNSAINIRGGLSFINSLLLPILALVLANLDKLTQFF